MKATQPLNPTIPRSGTAMRNMDNLRTRRMLPRLVATPNMDSD